MLNSLKHYFFSISILMTSAVSAQDIEDIYQQVLQSDPQVTIESLGVEVGTATRTTGFWCLITSSFN